MLTQKDCFNTRYSFYQLTLSPFSHHHLPREMWAPTAWKGAEKPKRLWAVPPHGLSHPDGAGDESGWLWVTSRALQGSDGRKKGQRTCGRQTFFFFSFN